LKKEVTAGCGISEINFLNIEQVSGRVNIKSLAGILFRMKLFQAEKAEWVCNEVFAPKENDFLY